MLAHLERCAICGHTRGWHERGGACHATVLEHGDDGAPATHAHVCYCGGFVETGVEAEPAQRFNSRDARALQDAGLRGDLAPDAVFEALIGELEARDETLTVDLDPSVADWTPDCWQCGHPIECWADAVALPASPHEDGEPTGVIFIHKRGCEATGA